MGVPPSDPSEPSRSAVGVCGTVDRVGSVTVDSLKVPQHLELEDVVAWGLGATDLVCVLIGGVGGWWVYLVVARDVGLRALFAAPGRLLCLSFVVSPAGDLALPDWVSIATPFSPRP